MLYNKEEELALQEAMESAADKIAAERSKRQFDVLKEQMKEQLRQNKNVLSIYNNLVRTIDTVPDSNPNGIMKRAIDVAGLAAVSKAPYLYSQMRRALTNALNRISKLGKLEKSTVALIERATISYEQKIQTVKDPEIRNGIQLLVSSLKNLNTSAQSKIVNNVGKNDMVQQLESVEMSDDDLAKCIDNILSEADDLAISVLLGENMVATQAKRATAKVMNATRVVRDNVGDTVNAVKMERDKQELLRIRKEVMAGRIPFMRYVKFCGAILATYSGALPPIVLVPVLQGVLRRKKLRRRERMNMITELRTEMEIINEKIKDAEADNDRQKKYNYIRLRREIQRAIDQLRYGQNFAVDRSAVRL